MGGIYMKFSKIFLTFVNIVSAVGVGMMLAAWIEYGFHWGIILGIIVGVLDFIGSKIALAELNAESQEEQEN
jgi:hypothetical protein